MSVRRPLAALVLAAVAMPVLATNACTVFEPEVGPRQEGVVAAAPAATDPGSYGYGPRPDAGDGGDPRCLPDGGYADTPCDGCENTNCCTTRFACYGDATCAAADKAFDPCLAAAAYTPTDPTAVKKCWDTLAASGPAAAARVDCQRAKCKTICSVP